MRRSPDNFLGGDAHDVEMPLNYYVWVVSNDRRSIVVDTGFNEAMAQKRNRQIVKPVAQGLKALGIEPDKVKDVIITHMHYDHAGNIPLFANARYHLQDKEMDFATGRCMCHGLMRHGYEADDVVHLVRCVFDQRVQFHDGASEISPGVELHHIGGHTKGMQSVRVRTAPRLGRARFRCQPFLCAHGAGSRFSHPVQPRRHAGRVQHPAPACDFAPAHHSGPRSTGDGALSRGEGGHGRLDSAAGCRPVEVIDGSETAVIPR
jgi:hypothetical protein